MSRRVPPLAIAFALMAAALVATTWTTRSTVIDASTAVRDGNALAVQQAVRADSADLGGPPSEADLAALLQDHAAEGLRYVAMLDKGRVIVAAGTPVGDESSRARHGTENRRIELVGGRVRVEQRMGFRRAWGEGGRAWWIVMEIEPVQADALRGAATRTLAIGAIAALTLLGVAIALMRRELRRHAEERAREHERRLASLGEMSAVLAHEIRNPLASLKGNAQLLAATLPEGEKSRAKAERVVDESVRLERLTNDLLQFVRTGELHRAPVEIAALFPRDDRVELAVAGAWPLDADRMRQVFANLVDNALQAGPPVRVSARVERERLVVEVADHGPGVPEADREHIFEPFVTKKEHGTGLGLAVARRIVELHGGTIGVRNDPAGGAVFRVEIPR